MDKRPVRPSKLVSGPKRSNGKCERSDVDGMDEGYVESEDETEAQNTSDAVVPENMAPTQTIGDSSAEEVIHAKEAEAWAPRVPRVPRTPRQQEIVEHEVAHCPHRSWSEQCVRK